MGDILGAILVNQVGKLSGPLVGVNAPARTEDPDNQTNDIAKGNVMNRE